MPGNEEIWLVAADAWEFRGLLPHCARVQPVSGPVAWLRVGELGGRRVWMAANGAGPRLAAAALSFLRQRADAAVVVSTGFCGGLAPELETGDIVVATELRFDEERIPLPLPAAGKAFRAGPLVSVDRIVGTAREKRGLAETGAVAVEMEAAGLAPLVRQWKLPFFCVRSVSDRAVEDFGLDLNRARVPSGRISTTRLFRQALRKPASGIPELLRLRRQSWRAAKSLGDFLADCRF